jgi:hypothetical protein
MSEIGHNGGPAFPIPEQQFTDGVMIVSKQGHDGMSLRTYAAIKLRVPNSGIAWLDDMIREAKRDEFAGQALAGICASGPTKAWHDAAIAREAFNLADAMLAARKVKS